MYYGRRQEFRARNHGVTPEVLANLKRQFKKFPRGTLLNRDGSLLSLGDGTAGSGERRLHGRTARTETRKARPVCTNAARVLAKAEALLHRTRPVAERIAEAKAAATAKFLYAED